MAVMPVAVAAASVREALQTSSAEGAVDGDGAGLLPVNGGEARATDPTQIGRGQHRRRCLHG